MLREVEVKEEVEGLVKLLRVMVMTVMREVLRGAVMVTERKVVRLVVAAVRVGSMVWQLQMHTSSY